jgi:hypothetical protein
MTALFTSAKRTRTVRRRAISLSALAGISYAAAWIISLSVGAPNPSVSAPGRQVVSAFAGHRGPSLAMFALAEGVAAIALVGVMLSAAHAARRSGHPRAGVAAAILGIAVAAVSWTQLVLGIWLISGLVPDRRTATAGAVYQTIVRIDGAKMFLLAALALAVGQLARTRILPRWLAPLGVVLAAALLTSGLGFILRATGLAATVMVSGTLLVIFVCATGIVLRRRDVKDIGSGRLRRA